MSKDVLKKEFVNVPLKIVDTMLEIDKLEAQKRQLSNQITMLKAPVEQLKQLYRGGKKTLELAVEHFGDEKVYKHIDDDGNTGSTAFTEHFVRQLELFASAEDAEDGYESPIPDSDADKDAVAQGDKPSTPTTAETEDMPQGAILIDGNEAGHVFKPCEKQVSKAFTMMECSCGLKVKRTKEDVNWAIPDKRFSKAKLNQCPNAEPRQESVILEPVPRREGQPLTKDQAKAIADDENATVDPITGEIVTGSGDKVEVKSKAQVKKEAQPQQPDIV